jgi:tetratricopeptide (TPR) repeat protein
MRVFVNQFNLQNWGHPVLYFIGKLIAFLLFMLLCTMPSKAQKTAIYEDEVRYYNRGLELFDKEKYAAAFTHFNWYVGLGKSPQLKIKSEYYAATCAMELFSQDAEQLLKNIMAKYPENNSAKLAVFQLGKLHYRAKNNKEAVKWLQKVDPSYLSEIDRIEFYFTSGYCHFKVNQFEASKKSFIVIKDTKSKFYDAANYYYAYVCYQSKDFEEALTHFKRVQSHKTFGPLSTVYVAQIYFSRKQFESVINYCDTITNKELAIDVAGILGQSYFNLHQYAKAVPYLEIFMKDAPVMPKNEDYYQLGISYYKTAQYAQAIDQLLKIEQASDTLKQAVWFALADSYIKVQKKNNALSAFNKSYEANAYSELGEQSLFNSARIAEELNFQGQAMQTYARFLDSFPASKYANEARTNLGNLLLNARNYKEAIRILEHINNPGKAEKILLQKVYYFRAEELYLNSQIEEAKTLFEKNVSIRLDANTLALSTFWLAEIAYKQNQFKEAISLYLTAQEIPEFKTSKYYSGSFYEKAYALLKTEDYESAVASFKQYVKISQLDKNPEIYTDAVIRIADCYFVSKQYQFAIDYYDKVIQNSLNGSDYALFQKALILGVMNRYEEKSVVLKSLIKTYPKSPYIDDAVFESANLHLLNEKYELAVAEFNELISKYPRSIYIRKAKLNKALSLFNLKNDEEALAVLKQLITDFPNSEEAIQGLLLVKNILVNKGEGEAYIEFVNVLPHMVLAPSTQDSLSYEAAFNLYKNNELQKAAKSLGSYINKFPGGFFILKANYFKAEADYTLKNYDAALVHYEYVANALRSDFTERATRQAATLNYMKKQYDQAYTFYAALERIASNKDNTLVALLGQMRSSVNQGKQDSAANAAFKYINSGMGLKDPMVEAHLQIGRYYMAHNKSDSAQLSFQYILKESKLIFAAEAKYNMALIQFQKKEYKATQKLIFDLADHFSAFELWVAKAYQLLAETYVKQNDFFQAKATLQSLIDNYEGEEITNACKVRMLEIIEIENQQKNTQKQQVEQRINQHENK